MSAARPPARPRSRWLCGQGPGRGLAHHRKPLAPGPSAAKVDTGATAFNQDLNQWNTAAVIDMMTTIAGASAFNQSLCWRHSADRRLAGMCGRNPTPRLRRLGQVRLAPGRLCRQAVRHRLHCGPVRLGGQAQRRDHQVVQHRPGRDPRSRVRHQGARQGRQAQATSLAALNATVDKFPAATSISSSSGTGTGGGGLWVPGVQDRALIQGPAEPRAIIISDGMHAQRDRQLRSWWARSNSRALPASVLAGVHGNWRARAPDPRLAAQARAACRTDYVIRAAAPGAAGHAQLRTLIQRFSGVCSCNT